jgi:hypothetical protein
MGCTNTPSPASIPAASTTNSFHINGLQVTILGAAAFWAKTQGNERLFAPVFSPNASLPQPIVPLDLFEIQSNLRGKLWGKRSSPKLPSPSISLHL